MGRKNILRQFPVYKQSDSSINPVSEITDVSGLDNITHLIVIDPTVVGLLFVEFSNEEAPSNPNASLFKPLSFGEQLALNGSTETVYMTKIENHGFKWLRLSFQNNAGSGLINAWISGNSVGA